MDACDHFGFNPSTFGQSFLNLSSFGVFWCHGQKKANFEKKSKNRAFFMNFGIFGHRTSNGTRIKQNGPNGLGFGPAMSEHLYLRFMNNWCWKAPLILTDGVSTKISISAGVSTKISRPDPPDPRKDAPEYSEHVYNWSCTVLTLSGSYISIRPKLKIVQGFQTKKNTSWAFFFRHFNDFWNPLGHYLHCCLFRRYTHYFGRWWLWKMLQIFFRIFWCGRRDWPASRFFRGKLRNIRNFEKILFLEFWCKNNTWWCFRTHGFYFPKIPVYRSKPT